MQGAEPAGADLKPSTWQRAGVALLVAALHAVAAIGLIRAFAPDLGAQVIDRAVAAFTITVATPPPPPAPSPTPSPAARAPEPRAAAGEAGRKATPREIMAPRPKVALAQHTAPPVASTGSADRSGARENGEGAGADGQGSGTGAGTGGSGSGGAGAGAGAATRAEKIAGDINSARDYPRGTRDLRIDDYVIVALTVGTDGRVRACRIVRASRDAQADQITCRLATERFRFRPATDAGGRAVEAVYGWKQRWFYPHGKD